MESASWDRRYGAWIFAAVYALAVIAVAARHEPWADEAQAWLIARDSNPVAMAADVLRYEGHPILWYLVLTPFAKTLPYAAMTVVAVCFGIAGVLLWLLRSPVPPAIRFAVPFTYFLFYQYAVVARSYVLLPLLLFWLAHEYPRRHERPWRFVLICSLLTFTSVFPAVGAGFVMLAFFVEALMRIAPSCPRRRSGGTGFASGRMPPRAFFWSSSCGSLKIPPSTAGATSTAGTAGKAPSTRQNTR